MYSPEVVIANIDSLRTQNEDIYLSTNHNVTFNFFSLPQESSNIVLKLVERYGDSLFIMNETIVASKPLQGVISGTQIQSCLLD